MTTEYSGNNDIKTAEYSCDNGCHRLERVRQPTGVNPSLLVTWTFVVTSSHSSKGEVSTFARERSRRRHFVSRSFLLVPFTANQTGHIRLVLV